MSTMNSKGTKILDAVNIEHTIRRIAFQIFEHNESQREIIVAGIAENGSMLAKRLYEVLKSISDCNVVYVEIFINKTNLRAPITTSIPLESCKHKSIVVVDDVLNTGGTLIYAVNHFLQVPLTQLKTAVMVNRNHKKFPIKADFKGISLSTSLKERVDVILDEGIYLN